MQPVDIEDAAGAGERTPLQSLLLDWYDANHRVLPWRRNSRSKLAAPAGAGDARGWPTTPGTGAPLSGLSRADFAYGVWVSELMLQQTQVDRVLPYFCRWMAAWPTAAQLAAASEEEVNELWAGLGYYRRARFLLQGARYAVEHSGGELPTTRADLLNVPGIGAYTAASVSSIAFGEASAAVDGNVVRVLSRLHALAQANPASSAATKQMQALADSVLCRRRPGDWNQAVMELGAVVCKPQAPRCDACPVASCCVALKRVQDAAAADAPPPLPAVTDFPTRVAKAPRRVEAVCVRVVEWQNNDTDATWLLMLKRPEGGLLSGLWEFPSALSLSDVAATLAALGLPEANGPATPAVQVVHVFSHIEHHMAVERITLVRSTSPPELARNGGTPWRWVQQPAEGGAPPGLTGGVGKVWSAVFSQPRAPATKARKKPRT